MTETPGGAFVLQDYTEALDAAATTISKLSPINLHARVPACPGWDVSDVLHHLGSVFTHVGALVRRRPIAPKALRLEEPPVPKPGDTDVLAWFLGTAALLREALIDAGDDEVVWSWGANESALFWSRRMAHETVVHAYDVGEAVGREVTFSTAMLVDGVDEFLSEFVQLMRSRSDQEPESPQSFKVSCGTAVWHVTLGGHAVILARGTAETATTDGAITADSPDQLLLWLWRRRRQQGGRVRIEPAPAAAAWDRLVGSP